jgi:diguanylate cyclase (GGDEF)-like protein
VVSTDERTDKGGLAVLLFASDQRLRRRLLRVLSRRGHQAISCTRCDELPALCAAGPVQLALIGWNPDAAAASEACRVVRLTAGTDEALILAILDGRKHGQLEAALAAGADDFICFPAREDVLDSRLAVAERRIATLGEARLAARGEDSRPHQPASSQNETTNRKLLEQQLLHNAFHDSLTGLPNRALLSERVAQALARGRRRESFLLAVLVLDVDRFKVINDSLGHEAGDRLLMELGGRLKALHREIDTVARLGGDEFALLLEELEEPRQASLVAERIRSELGRPFDLGGQEVFATVSTGIALSEGGDQKAEELLRDADTAMYRAKANGRNCYAIFDPQMHARAVAILQLENDLRHALARAELCAYFQPIISLSSGRITGFEALARWHHPRRGLLLPADFIAVAEETGLIVPLDRLVLNAACRQARSWAVRFHTWLPLTMSVNISGKQFTQPDLVMQVDHALRSSGLWGQALKLEITETAIMENAALAVAMLEQLRTLAITFSIDDFGTGYSSLSNLRHYEIDTLKIDTSFVARMIDEEETSEIVGALINLAFNLHKDLVAEGVESPLQLARLRELGCTHAQGYLFSPPLNAEAATELLASDPRW